MIENELGNILIYQNENGDTKIDVYFENDTIWLSQKNIAKLYQVEVPTINEHISTILSDEELDEIPTIRNFRIVGTEGTREVSREVKHYNLDMILAIGYRVRSNVGAHFRKWTTKILSEYMKKGFVMNDERLKNPKKFGEDFFDELLERIRDIRSSEKRFYLKVTDIFSTSLDYDKNSELARTFFSAVQNKLHFAIHGNTAAELISKRADASKNNMGLTSFEGVKVRKKDIGVAKNYLTHEEIDTLNRIVTMYLDYAELQAKNKKPMHMADWENKLNNFLEFNERDILQTCGKISHGFAIKTANEEYEKFDLNRKSQDLSIDTLTVSVDDIKGCKK